MADKALLVGINTYPGAPLRGCVNDINDMANRLVKDYKFARKSIRPIVDRRATTSAILSRLHWLVDCKPGDRCLFHFSGHGTQFPTRSYRHEIDGLLEVICPVDFDWSERHMITDKQLIAIFNKIPKGVRFSWISDCCHSGNLTRGIPPRNSKNNPIPEQVPRAYPRPFDIEWRGQVARSEGIKPVARGGRTLNVGFASGCRSDQTSADAFINGRHCGAMTHFFLKHLRKKTSLANVVIAASNDLKKHRYTQRPQSEGSQKNKPFLG